MTTALKKSITALKKLLKVHDSDNLEYALELAVSLSSPEVWLHLLEGVTYVQGQTRARLKRKDLPTTIGHLIPGKHFAKSPGVVLWNELVTTYLLARSDLALCNQITHLELLGGTEKKPLPIKLDGLESFRNLENLTLEIYAETDLLPLAMFKKLKTLTINDHRTYSDASDITLSGLKQLETLFITAPESNNSYWHYAPTPTHSPQCVNLSTLPKLKIVTLYCDLGDVSGLNTITELSINTLRDYTLNKACKNLQRLTCQSFSQPRIQIPNGATLTNDTLEITVNVEDLGEISQVQKLKMITFRFGGYSTRKPLKPKLDLSPLMSCCQLKVIKLMCDLDVSVLAGHPSLKLIACANTSVRKESVPVSMKKLINRGAKPNIDIALKEATTPPPQIKSKPLNVTTTSRKQVSQLRKLLTQPDYTSLTQGVELAASINNPEVFALLLEGVTYTEEPLQAKDGSRPVTLAVEGRLIPNKIFSGSQYRQPWLDVAMALLLAHSKLPLKHKVRGLTLGSRLYSTSPLERIPLLGLEKLPNLERLELFLTNSQADLKPITRLPALKNLRIQAPHLNDIVIPSNNNVETIEGTQVRLDDSGHWPCLRVLQIKERLGNLPSTHSLPKLETLEISGILNLKGFKQLSKLVVTNATLHIEDCPKLTQLVGKRIEMVTITGSCSLNQVSLDFCGKNAEFLQQLTTLNTLEFSGSSVETIAIPKGASLSGTLSLNCRHLRTLGNLGELENLQRLSLRSVKTPLDLSTLANAKALRVLDIRHAEGITDLTPLVGLSELRLVTIKNSGVINYPDELTTVVSRADQPDLIAAFSKPRPKAKATKPKIPVPESQRKQWMEVTAKLATNTLDTALKAIDLAASLDPSGLEFLAGKIKVKNDKLRAYSPISLDDKLMLVPVTNALLCKMPDDSKTARPLRTMRKLVIEGNIWGSGSLNFYHLSGFLSLEHIVAQKVQSISIGNIEDTRIISMSLKSYRSVSLEGNLPSSLKHLIIGRCQTVALTPIGESQLETLSLYEVTTVDIAEFADCKTLNELNVHPSYYSYAKGITGESELSQLNVKILSLPCGADMRGLINHPTLERLNIIKKYGKDVNIPKELEHLSHIG